MQRGGEGLGAVVADLVVAAARRAGEANEGRGWGKVSEEGDGRWGR